MMTANGGRHEVEGERWPATTYTIDSSGATPDTPTTPPHTHQHHLHPTPHGVAASPSKWGVAWREFCETTSIHACRQIAEDQPYCLRRILWTVLLIVGVMIFVLQMIESISYYRQWPVAVNVKINYNHTLDFPAVTLCNHNSFRTTVTAEHGWYVLTSEMFGRRDLSPLSLNLTKFNASDVTLDQLYTTAAHDKHDMIVSCKWGTEPCTPDDFETTLTDFGVCYTFNGNNHPNGTLRVSKTGTRGGLRLHLNVEQYEYMRGPYDGAGIKLLLHRPQEVPLVRDLGVAVMPGTQSFVGIQILQIHNLGAPHGECDETKQLDYYNEYTSANCLINSFTKQTVQTCGCRDIFMPGDAPVCTLQQYQDCVLPLRHSGPRDNEQCPIPCFRVMYDPVVTYASTSNFDLEKMLQSPYIRDVQSKYIRARETLQRVDTKIVRKDVERVEKLMETRDLLQTALQNIRESNDVARGEIHQIRRELESRMKFHLERALDGIVFTVKHDYIRGWEVRDERVLRYVTGPYFETSFIYKLVLDQLSDTSDATQRRLVWSGVEQQLRSKINYATMAEYNITEVYEAYTNGTPLLKFKYTPNRRYDLSFISLPVLSYGYSAQYKKEIYTEFKKGVSMYVAGLDTMVDVGRNVSTSGGTVDDALVQATIDGMHAGARRYNYRVFMFRERIVNKPLELLDYKLDSFRSLQAVFSAKMRDLDKLLDSIDQQLETLDSLLDSVNKFTVMCVRYLQDVSSTKTDLAKHLSSAGMTDVDHQVDMSLLALRSRGRELSDTWSGIADAILDVWKNMIDETCVHGFYNMVNDDVQLIRDDPYNTTLREYFDPIFGALITDKETDEVRDMDADTLHRLMNADVPSVNISHKEEQVRGMFFRLAEATDVTESLRDVDHEFLKVFQDLKQHLLSFVDGHKVDNTFYKENFLRLDIFLRELSYEEIIQERAYDITKLLCDIGGSIGLFVGASALSLFEIIDALVNTACLNKQPAENNKWIALKKKNKSSSTPDDNVNT